MAVKTYFNAQGCRKKTGFRFILRRWIEYGSPDVPVRVPGGVVPITRARASIPAVVAITEAKGDRPR